ncbi:MAG: type II toxin-antitoxin system VapC family toxin [Candidatus Altiarchaeota archaeon]
MKVKAFLDSNIFNIGIENHNTNCWIIIELALSGRIALVISGLTVKEVGAYFRRAYTRHTGWLVEEFITNIPDVVFAKPANEKTRDNRETYGLSIEDATLFSAAQEAGSDYFVSLNRHFLKSKIQKPKILNPKEFLDAMKIKSKTEYE